MYLEFIEFDDYVAYLKHETGADKPMSRIEIGNTVGPLLVDGFQSITYHAIFTRAFNDGTGTPLIATTAITLMETTNMHLRTDLQEVKDKLHRRFDEMQEKVSQQLTLARGKWRHDPPYYHK